jgi:uncharacterized protein
MRATLWAGRLLWTVTVLLTSALALIMILSLLERVVVYHPHPYRANYRQLLKTGVVELRFETRAGRQTAFYVAPRSSDVPKRLWVAFCGNGSLALDWLPLTARDHNPGDAFLLIDYPGYGNSHGWANVANTRAAADGALVALAARLRIDAAALEPRLNAIGHSLGAAAALDFARHHREVGRIILLAPFTSLREEAAIFISEPFSRLLRNDYDNRAALRELAGRKPPPRVTIFHGLADALIPAAMGQELATEFPSFVAFRGVPDANHDTVVAAAEDEILEVLGDRAGQDQL